MIVELILVLYFFHTKKWKKPTKMASLRDFLSTERVKIHRQILQDVNYHLTNPWLLNKHWFCDKNTEKLATSIISKSRKMGSGVKFQIVTHYFLMWVVSSNDKKSPHAMIGSSQSTGSQFWIFFLPIVVEERKLSFFSTFSVLSLKLLYGNFHIWIQEAWGKQSMSPY